GRPHELEVVAAALARAFRERRPTAVVVDGEPGVGKSRLIDEASRNFRGDRLAVSAYEPEMSLPFSLGHDLTRALARSSRAAEQILDPMLAPEPAARGPTGRPCSRRPIARPAPLPRRARGCAAAGARRVRAARHGRRGGDGGSASLGAPGSSPPRCRRG